MRGIFRKQFLDLTPANKLINQVLIRLFLVLIIIIFYLLVFIWNFTQGSIVYFVLLMMFSISKTTPLDFYYKETSAVVYLMPWILGVYRAYFLLFVQISVWPKYKHTACHVQHMGSISPWWKENSKWNALSLHGHLVLILHGK